MRSGAARAKFFESWLLWLTVSAIAVLIVVKASAQSRDVAIVVSPRNSVTNISIADLRKTFAGQKHSWPGGAPVKLIVRGPGTRERITLLRILGMSESEYKQYWTAQIFRGEADAEPSIVPSFGMVKEAMKVFPGAIALVDPQDVRPGMDLKVIKVDGRLPGEDGYPIH